MFDWFKRKRTDDLDEIFTIIRKLAKRDLRVGQMMINLVLSDMELFYMENDELLRSLKKCYKDIL